MTSEIESDNEIDSMRLRNVLRAEAAKRLGNLDSLHVERMAIEAEKERYRLTDNDIHYF